MAELVDLLGIEDLTDFEIIGSGGFATVYSAWDTAFNRSVAVKVLPNSDEGILRSFERERGFMGQLSDHPNVITPYRHGYTSSGSVYLVMEHMKAGSLLNLIEEEGAIEVAKMINYALAIADALAHSHAHGILHKDIKPANILLSDKGVPKLSDFGISTIREQTATSIAYTLAHTPPETFDNGFDSRDERSDLYSLASTMFTGITGTDAYWVEGQDSIAAYMRRIEEHPLPQVGIDYLDSFFARAMAKDPADRFETVTAFTAALHRLRGQAQASSPSTSGSPSPTSQLEPAIKNGREPDLSDPFAGSEMVFASRTGSVSSPSTPVRDRATAVPDRQEQRRINPLIFAGVALATVAVIGGALLFRSISGESSDLGAEQVAGSSQVADSGDDSNDAGINGDNSDEAYFTGFDIYDVDFLNGFTHGFYNSQPIVAEDGVYQSEVVDFRLEVLDVAYGDLDGDGNDEAVVVTLTDTGDTGAFNRVTVYRAEADRTTTVIGQPSGGDRGLGGVIASWIEDSAVFVENYSDETAQGNATRTIYRLGENGLVADDSELETRSFYRISGTDEPINFKPSTSSVLLAIDDQGIAVFNLSKGQTLSVETAGTNEAVDPMVFEVDGTELTSTKNGATTVIPISETGTYIVELQPAEGSNSETPSLFVVRVEG